MQKPTIADVHDLIKQQLIANGQDPDNPITILVCLQSIYEYWKIEASFRYEANSRAWLALLKPEIERYENFAKLVLK